MYGMFIEFYSSGERDREPWDSLIELFWPRVGDLDFTTKAIDALSLKVFLSFI